jgi:hypothetical protein
LASNLWVALGHWHFWWQLARLWEPGTCIHAGVSAWGMMWGSRCIANICKCRAWGCCRTSVGRRNGCVQSVTRSHCKSRGATATDIIIWF